MNRNQTASKPRDWMPRTAAVFCAGALAAGMLAVWPQAAEAADNISRTTAERTKEQIVEKWMQNYLPMKRSFSYMSGNDIYEQLPSLTAPFQEGKLKAEYIEDGVRAANFVRYLAGVPDDVQPDWSLDRQEQTASLINALNDKLSHSPAKPAGMEEGPYKLGYAGAGSSNLYMGSPTLYSSVLGYMSDSDPSNIDRVGHRRWILNPAMTKTMFGYVRAAETGGYGSPYSSMYVFDKGRAAGSVDYDFIGWPAAGYFPSEAFSPSDAWSVSLNTDRYDKTDTDSITVTVTRQGDGRKWMLDKSDTDKSGEYFRIDKGGYGGIPVCIIFRPEGISDFKEDDRFHVRIDGLRSKTGPETSIEYDTVFFRMTEMKRFGSDAIAITPGESVPLRLYSTGEGAVAGRVAGQLESSDPSIASVDSSGILRGVKAGAAYIRYSNYLGQENSLYVTVRPSAPGDTPSGWAKEAYAKAKGAGLIPYSLDTQYQTPIRRIDFVRMLVGVYENTTGSSLPADQKPFQDTSDSNVSKAVSAGLISGISPTEFAPLAKITRQEAAALLTRLEGKLSAAAGRPPASAAPAAAFADDGAIASWAKADVYRSVGLGLMQGVGRNSFDPIGSLTVEQSIQIFQRTFERFTEN
ncbi:MULTISPECIES: S-layer homology domain-containing protein [unclassified Paenibacillus]|uniref:S-layer homology domain-containing protein n=1 Tax=unclassified Paenibacillus TaxID=185978 RepID=UPI00095711FB|nr:MULTISPECIES: S-layer homology domain-containing protein [unclassified Paenibacillus]ASS67768.1 S-layer protein [Paenibacillus sp. RUD330]SIR61167.1 S-layer homology domain-containing protein [Paenibacillus sp. RU4X]SIR69791.1 S-layer homology domain-containing protein [Paenibacillus sp. RU4T]